MNESKKNKERKSKGTDVVNKTFVDAEQNEEVLWKAGMLAYLENVTNELALKFISLLNEGWSLPFIARYRKGMVNNLMPDRLQELYESFQYVDKLRIRINNVLDKLKERNLLTTEIKASILNAKNKSEIELVLAPFELDSPSLAERARELGLECHALSVLDGTYLDMESLCNVSEEQLSSVEKIEDHITHLVADIIYKHANVKDKMLELKNETKFIVQTWRTESSLNIKEDKINKKVDSKADPLTYKKYFEWECLIQNVRPHQTLAINRAEGAKILNVKIVIPDEFYNSLERFCLSRKCWKSECWVKKGLGNAYNHLIKPWLSRQIRFDLRNAAEKEAVKIFTNNLQNMLLTKPIKKIILGLDPGFKDCKVGVVDCNGKELDTGVIKVDLIDYDYEKNNECNDNAVKKLKKLLGTHKFQLIGLGNGMACRETGIWLNDIMKKEIISEDLPVIPIIPVIIVGEEGTSVYSTSAEAQREHPNMDPKLISALSIARRVLDPLGELIKVNPKNLGVGLYQHDIPPKMLESALDCTVENIVSLVGVDINTASQALLRRIAGLNESRVENIISYRQSVKGPFKTRAEILKVTGIGKITFKQCAGFLKVIGGVEPLDSTIIHPESYKVAKSLAKKLGINLKDLRNPEFAQIVETKVASIDIVSLSQEFDSDVSTMELIINAFKQKSYEDKIIEFRKAKYLASINSPKELTIGMTVTGVVGNVLSYGCFVDCGGGSNKFLHFREKGNNQTPETGDTVLVTVLLYEDTLALRLEKILNSTRNISNN